MGKLFISYRRKDWAFAQRLAESLEIHMDAEIFFDFKIKEDDFERTLTREITQCDVFVLIVGETTFELERVQQEEDWIRREVKLALNLKKPIALVLFDTNRPPHSDLLPADICQITNKQGIEFVASFYDAAVLKLTEHCVNISAGTLRMRQPDDASSQPLPQQVRNTAYGGDQSINLPGATFNNNKLVEISTGGSKRQEVLAHLKFLRDEEKRIQKQINMQGYNLRNQSNISEITIWAALGFSVVFCSFSISPSFGIMVLVVVCGLVLFKQLVANDENRRKTEVTKSLEQQLHKAQSEIEKLNRSIRSR